ncbi:MAG: UDP-N-acetylmuramate--L-alanine ligase [Candidatus Omnitrophota bacterium]
MFCENKKGILENKHFHFVGIGGIGMSALAGIITKMGCVVSGSDLARNNLTDDLRRGGARIFGGHSPSNLPKNAEIVVYSSSVQDNNPELREAAARGLRTVQRGALLAELLNRKKGVTVAGTHGKTTTSSLISVVLTESGIDPTVAVGGEVVSLGSNARFGRSEWFVAESDESDGSFLMLKPEIAVLTNVEMEHADYYRTMKSVLSAYGEFIRNIKRSGTLFYCVEDDNIASIVKGANIRKISYGLSSAASVYPARMSSDGFRTSYICVRDGKKIGDVTLNLPGRHNILNSLAAIMVGMEIGAPFKNIAASLAGFRGTKRRFQIRFEGCGITLIEDYAHHPTEIRAVFGAVQNFHGRRKIAIFQPHRFSRTRQFAKKFGECFEGVDMVILTDIYSASENPIEGVDARTIYNEMSGRESVNVIILKKEKIVDHVMGSLTDRDMIFVLGAGDIRNVADDLESRLRKKFVKFEGRKEREEA